MAKLDDMGLMQWSYIEDITFNKVKVSKKVVNKVKEQGRNWKPVFVVLKGYKDYNSVFECVEGHNMISACVDAGFDRVWAIQIPSADCI